jgi:hypothetical protein
LKPQVDEACLFLHAIREKRDARALLREALSNAHDAGASQVHIGITGHEDSKLSLRIEDDGEGILRADFRRFFGLGLSGKKRGRPSSSSRRAIGEKGLGTKLYLGSERVEVDTRNFHGEGWRAIMLRPLEHLEQGELPTYHVKKHDVDLPSATGTRITLTRLRLADVGTMLDADGLAHYLGWFSAAGSAVRLFRHPGSPLRVHLDILRGARAHEMRVVEGHPLPASTPLDPHQDPRRLVHRFPPFRFRLRDEAGRPSSWVDVAGAVVGSQAHVVQDRRLKKRYKGFFLGKDGFAVRAVNEEVARGTGRWQSFHVVADCADLTLTPDRDDFADAAHGGLFARVIDALRQFHDAATAGRPFEYFGERVEGVEDCAGRGYARLQALKSQRRQDGARDALSLALFKSSAGRAEEVLRPQDEMGTLLLYQHLAQARRTPAHPPILGVLPGAPPVAVLRSAKDSERPKLYALAHRGDAKGCKRALDLGLDGLICWRYVGDAPCAGLDVMVLHSGTGDGVPARKAKSTAQRIRMNRPLK